MHPERDERIVDRAAGIAPRCLDLEIAESALMQDDARIVTSLEALRADGEIAR
jgi:EAL domain-containing protein (putative c-di-GMP-specific phosphodiesterase class I)